MILISTPRSWQAYYWWLSDDRAPAFARTVDIHRKPGYDPVELFFDPATGAAKKGTGSFCRNGPEGARHKRCLSPFRRPGGSARCPAGERLARRPGGEPLAAERAARSEPLLFPGPSVADTDVFGMVLRHFGLQ